MPRICDLGAPEFAGDGGKFQAEVNNRKKIVTKAQLHLRTPDCPR
jgi:hypothetical protein